MTFASSKIPGAVITASGLLIITVETTRAIFPPLHHPPSPPFEATVMAPAPGDEPWFPDADTTVASAARKAVSASRTHAQGRG